MNRSSFALFVALLIHITLLLTFWVIGSLAPEIKPTKKPQEKRIKLSLKEMPKKYKKSGDTKKVIKKTSKIPPMPKGSQLKQMRKKTKQILKHKVKKHHKRKTKKIYKKPKPKISKIKPVQNYKKPYIVLDKQDDINTTKVIKNLKQKQQKPDTEMAWLYEDKSSQEEKTTQKSKMATNGITSDIKELYGDEFGKLTQGQQKYILDNQEIMRRITQRVLNRVARVNIRRDLNVNTTNIIEFYLYPNGDISDFKFLKKSGYYILDDTTKETIEYSYSKYPRPTEKTLIRYNVFYNLAR
ncbi:MAG: hypothetical protein GXO30_02850 [Epsilonproteobacteria bacterium]|nr:hypothetical protein [Campylobacterota bacterium]